MLWQSHQGWSAKRCVNQEEDNALLFGAKPSKCKTYFVYVAYSPRKTLNPQHVHKPAEKHMQEISQSPSFFGQQMMPVIKKLPEGWFAFKVLQMHVDAGTPWPVGTIYYHNPTSKKTEWHLE